MNEEKALVLKHPVQIGSMDPVKVLNFRRIKGKDLRKMDLVNPTMDDMLELAEKLTGQTTSIFDEMDAADVLKVVETVGNLLGDSQETGS